MTSQASDREHGTVVTERPEEQLSVYDHVSRRGTPTRPKQGPTRRPFSLGCSSHDMVVTTDDELRAILGKETIAVVGCSSTPGKDAHEIPKYLQNQGYEVIPVNPNAEEVLGRPAYDSLSEVEEGIEIVDVFRPSGEVAGIVDEALARDDTPVIWLQLGIHDDEAVSRAEAAELRVVQDRCIKPEHRRLLASA